MPQRLKLLEMDKARRDALCACKGSTLLNFMKKLIASVGLAALGVSTLHAQYSPGLYSRGNGQAVVSWRLTLRGFYDDNPLTLPNGPLARTSYGTEVSPSASLNHTVNNTSFNLSYVYDWRYYESLSTSDTSHQLNASCQTELLRSLQHAGQRVVRRRPGTDGD